MVIFPPYNNYSNQQCDCEADSLKEENRRLEEERAEQRNQRIQEARELAEMQRRSASNWRQALDKQARLYAREAELYPPVDENGVDDFAISAVACKQAARIWDEIQTEKQTEIDELEARLAALQDSVRIETCSRLRKLYAGQPGELEIEAFVISSLEEGGDPEDWLNW